MAKHTVQESLSLKKFQKDIEKAKEKRSAERQRMKDKLEKQGYIFQKDHMKLEAKLKKKDNPTEKDLLEKLICLNITPIVHGASVQIRSGSEEAIVRSKRADGTIDELKARQALPGSHAMTHGFMALLEPEIRKFQKELKAFYKDLYKNA